MSKNIGSQIAPLLFRYSFVNFLKVNLVVRMQLKFYSEGFFNKAHSGLDTGQQNSAPQLQDFLNILVFAKRSFNLQTAIPGGSA